MKYRSNYEEKEKFVNEVIAQLVCNEGHFATCQYQKQADSNEELIKLIPHKYEEPSAKPRYICITADSVEAVCRDFMKQFIKILEDL